MLLLVMWLVRMKALPADVLLVLVPVHARGYLAPRRLLQRNKPVLVADAMRG